MKHINLYEDYKGQEIEDLIDDLSTVGHADPPLMVKARYGLAGRGEAHRLDPAVLYPVIEKLGEIMGMSPEEIKKCKEKKEIGYYLVAIAKGMKGRLDPSGSPIEISRE